MNHLHLLTTALLVWYSAAAPLPSVFRCRQVQLASLSITFEQVGSHDTRLLRIVGWCSELDVEYPNLDLPAASSHLASIRKVSHPTESLSSISSPSSSRSDSGSSSAQTSEPHLPPSLRRERDRQRQSQQHLLQSQSPLDHRFDHTTPLVSSVEPPLLTASDAHHISPPIPLSPVHPSQAIHPPRFPPAKLKLTTHGPILHSSSSSLSQSTSRLRPHSVKTPNYTGILPYPLTAKAYTPVPAQKYAYSAREFERGRTRPFPFRHYSSTSHDSYSWRNGRVYATDTSRGIQHAIETLLMRVDAFHKTRIVPLVRAVPADMLVAACLVFLAALVLWDVVEEWCEMKRRGVVGGDGDEDGEGAESGDDVDEEDARGKGGDGEKECVYELDAGRVRLDGEEKRLYA